MWRVCIGTILELLMRKMYVEKKKKGERVDRITKGPLNPMIAVFFSLTKKTQSSPT